MTRSPTWSPLGYGETMVKPAHLYLSVSFSLYIFKYIIRSEIYMPWRPVKTSVFRLPTRQEIYIITLSILASAMVCVYFVLRS